LREFLTGGKAREAVKKIEKAQFFTARTGVIPVPTVQSGWKKIHFFEIQ
jgi:hypothetical protein